MVNRLAQSELDIATASLRQRIRTVIRAGDHSSRWTYLLHRIAAVRGKWHRGILTEHEHWLALADIRRRMRTLETIRKQRRKS